MPVFVGAGDTSSRIRSNRVGFASHSANPGTASEGDVYFNSSDGGLRAYDGSAWSAVGAGGGTFSGIASGTLSNGQTVIIKSDGTVAGVTTSQATAGVAGTTAFDNNDVYATYAGYDPVNNKILIIWPDEGSNNTKAIVGTVNASSNTISFGSEVVFHSGGKISYSSPDLAILYDDTNNKFIVVYRSPGAIGYLKAKTATISGDSVTFGSESAPSPSVAGVENIYAAFDSDNAVFAVSTRSGSNSNHGRLHMGQISGTDISWSSNTATFASATTDQAAVGYDKTAKKFLVVYQYAGSRTESNVGTLTPGTNPSMSFGADSTISSGLISFPALQYSPTAEKLLVVYRNNSPNSVRSRVATISGTSVSYGTEVVLSSSINRTPKLVYNSSTTNIDLCIRDYIQALSISGTAVTTTGSSIPINSQIYYHDFVYDTNADRGVITAKPDGVSEAVAAIYTPSYVATNLTSTNFLGFSDAAYSDGATAKVQIVGSTDDAQTGLTTGSIHYVQTDGTLSTTAGTPSVVAGIALTDTKILIRK